MILSILELYGYNIPILQQKIEEEKERFHFLMQASPNNSTWTPMLGLPKHGRDCPSIIQNSETHQ
jgi:hypothetical protein